MSASTSRVLINNTALRNNGDVALVTALHDALRREGLEVTVATAQKHFARKHYPRLNVCSDVLGYAFGPAKRNALLGSLSALALLLLNPAYRRADILLGAPGGYLNSFYGFAWKTHIYRWARRLGKRTGIYSQSVGPLTDPDTQELRRLASSLDLLLVRDRYSHETARAAGFPAEKLVMTPDAVFLKEFRSDARSVASNVVGVSVRTWQHDGRNRSAYVDLICALVNDVLTRGFRVEFISTCQGVAGYTDDSELAREIARAHYSEEVAAGRVVVDCNYHTLEALEERLRTYHFVVGTRLHVCLLSLINGVPAFNISYEVKGRESYAYLGCPDFSIDYNEHTATGAAALERFLTKKEELRMTLPTVISKLNHETSACLKDALQRVLATRPALSTERRLDHSG